MSRSAGVTIGPTETSGDTNEGASFDQEDVREVPHHPPPWAGLGDLPEPSPQAEAGVIG